MKFGLKDIIYLAIIVALCGIIIFLIRVDKNLEQEIYHNKKLLDEQFQEITQSVEKLEQHKDSSISLKATEVKRKINDLKEKLSNNNISDFEKEKLKKELVKVKAEFDEYQSSIMFNMIDMMDAKDNEITLLSSKFEKAQEQLENCATSNSTTTVIKDKIQTHKVVASVNMNVMPLNKKGTQTYKARNTDFLKCDFRITGNLPDLGFSTINLIITDSSGKIISDKDDKIDITSKEFSYTFEPAKDYEFKSGKYTVKATNENSEFESIFSFTLSNKF